MLGDDRALRVVELPEGLEDIAEVLGRLLTSKLNEALKAAFAIEAKKSRTELMSALKEFRNGSRYEESDHVVEFTSDYPKAKQRAPRHSPVRQAMFDAACSARSSVNVSPAITSISSASCHSPCHSPMPAHRARSRLPSDVLERQLAEKVIAAKLLDSRGTSRHSSSVSSFQQVVPVDIERPQSHHNSEHTSQSFFTIGSQTFVRTGTMSTIARNLDSLDNLSVSRIPSTIGNRSWGLQLSRVATNNDSSDAPHLYGEGSRTSVNNGRSSGLTSRLDRSMHSSSTWNRWKSDARKFYDHKRSVFGESWGQARKIHVTVSRVLGVLPWETKFVWLSKVYQVLVLVALLLSTLNAVTNLSSPSIETNANNLNNYIDYILALGSSLSFLAAILKNHAWVESQFLVESFLSRAGFLNELNLKSCIEIVALFLVWLSCVVARFYARAFELRWCDFAFAFNVLALLGICGHVLRLCRGLLFIVDSFCQYMTEQQFDMEDAMQEWFLLHCTIRTTCASLQFCFVALQLTSIAIVLDGAASIYFWNNASNEVTIVSYVPGALCLIVLMQLSMRAAFVSDLCKRVPMLVNSTQAEFDLRRMYLVEYILHCETGFYIFEVRLSSAMLLKAFYIGCAATIGLLTQVLGRIF